MVEVNRAAVQVIALFESVWGASTATAEKWHAQGCKTISDVRARDDLTNQQLVGLKCAAAPNTQYVPA